MHTKTCGTLNSVALFTWLFHKQHLSGFKVSRAYMYVRMKNATVEISLLGPVYMEAGLAGLARQPAGKRDEFLLSLYEKISSRLPGQFCYIVLS
jgi:hypothetical protein